MNDPYKTLGISPSATDEEVKNAYRALARKYHPDNYSADNPLAELANEKMKEINEAYDTITKERADAQKYGSRTSRNGYYSANAGDGSTVESRVRILLNNNRIREAEEMLAGVPYAERTADWHFLESIVLLRRGSASDAMRELELACEMDPDNAEYQQAKRMFNGRSDVFGRTYYGNAGSGMRECNECDLCSTYLCASCLCNSCGPRC